MKLPTLERLLQHVQVHGPLSQPGMRLTDSPKYSVLERRGTVQDTCAVQSSTDAVVGQKREGSSSAPTADEVESILPVQRQVLLASPTPSADVVEPLRRSKRRPLAADVDAHDADVAAAGPDPVAAQLAHRGRKEAGRVDSEGTLRKRTRRTRL